MQSDTVPWDTGWHILLKDLGVERELVCGSWAALPQPKNGARVNVVLFLKLWKALEAAIGERELPLKLASVLSAESLSPALFGAFCSTNLAIAIERVSLYKEMMSPMRFRYGQKKGGLFLSPHWVLSAPSAPESLVLTELLFSLKMARLALRRKVVPLKVLSKQPLEPKQAYTDFLGVAPTVSNRNEIVFSLEDATEPFLTSDDDVLWRSVELELLRQNQLSLAQSSLSSKVEAILKEALPSGNVSVSSIAARLDLKPRTLQRLLKKEGVRFKEVVSQTREKLARYYVSKTQLGYPEISILLGFEEPNSFFRAFRKWTGTTPQASRRESPN